MKVYQISKHLAKTSDPLEYIGEVQPPVGRGDFPFADYWRVETAYIDFFIRLLSEMRISTLSVSKIGKGYTYASFPYEHEKKNLYISKAK